MYNADFYHTIYYRRLNYTSKVKQFLLNIQQLFKRLLRPIQISVSDNL